MLKIATPISSLFVEHSVVNAIIEKSDNLECRERSVHSTLPRQELFHFDVNINMPWNEAIRNEVHEAISAKPELLLATFQMASCYDDPFLEKGIFQPRGNRISRVEMLANVKVNLSFLKTFLLSKTKVGIENNNYYPTPAYEDITSGNFISEVVYENEIYFLLDIAHAMVTAYNSKTAYENYLESLPMDRAIQLHICQPEISTNDLMIDAHGLPRAEMDEEVIRLCQKWPIEYLTVEYYRDADGLLSYLSSLSSIRDLIEAHRKIHRHERLLPQTTIPLVSEADRV